MLREKKDTNMNGKCDIKEEKYNKGEERSVETVTGICRTYRISEMKITDIQYFHLKMKMER